MNFPLSRVAVVIGIGSIALLAHAGMTPAAVSVSYSATHPAAHVSSAGTSHVHAPRSAKEAGTAGGSTGSHAVTAVASARTSVISSGAKCDGVTNDTPAIQAAVSAAGKQSGAVVTIPAGVCALFGRVAVGGANGVTIEGAGAGSTFLVQHAVSNIFQITSPGNTVELMNLNTATYNPGYVPIRKSPVPAVLFSNANNTTVTNVTAETGTGFGMRLTGPKPCYTFPITGSVVSNVIMVNHGTGGFAAVDIDCQNGARLTNINIHGGILALYNDENTVLNGEVYYGVNACQPAWFVTGPANNILIENVVTYAGGGVIHNSRHGLATNIIVLTQTRSTSASC
jgi:hypothetical protein